ncbi:MAG: hypothetical protein ACOYUB_03425 [Patescibacteria group bacterium]
MSIYDFLLRHKDLLPSGVSAESQAINAPGYFTISGSDIKVFNIDVLSKLNNQDSSSWDIFEKHFLLLEKIRNNIVRLNHMGFGYKTADIEAEIDKYRKQLPKGFDLVEEDSGDKLNNRWFFIKPNDKNLPKIELILYSSNKYNDFYPQFQMDIDTDMTYEELKNTTSQIIGQDFFFWTYDVPNYGVVMAMGKIGKIKGVNILLGLGTNLRKPQSFKKI